MAGERHDVAFVVGAVLGGVAGAAITLLNAPQSGQQTRAQLAAQAEALIQALGAATSQVDDRALRLVDRAAGSIPGRGDQPGADAPAAVAVEPAGIGIGQGEAEPVYTLPDPLEPAPVVPTESREIGGDAGAAADTPGGVDVVIEGPRPTSADR